jgi:hypothetical protein
MEAVLVGDRKKYHERVDGLQTTVRALCGLTGSGLQRANNRIADGCYRDRRRHFVTEITRRRVEAVLLATWAEGYGAIEAANTIADLGLGPQRRFFIVLDELWKIVRTSMVDKIDQLTRLNRAEAAGQAMITHSLDDLESPAQESDRAKARGFITRAGMVIMGGLPMSELRGGDGKDGLQKVVYLSQKEIDLVASWEDGGSLSGRRRNRRGDKPPGAGKFLIKVGTKPGLPVEVITPPAENELHSRHQPLNDTATIDLTDDTTHRQRWTCPNRQHRSVPIPNRNRSSSNRSSPQLQRRWVKRWPLCSLTRVVACASQRCGRVPFVGVASTSTTQRHPRWRCRQHLLLPSLRRCQTPMPVCRFFRLIQTPIRSRRTATPRGKTTWPATPVTRQGNALP